MLKEAHILSNDKIYTISKNIIKIYNINNIKQFYTINCKKEIEINSAIELDNKDLIIQNRDEIRVYRLKNNNYQLIQTIYELTGKLRKEKKGTYMGHDLNEEVEFELDEIQKLANNRFMSVSNYEIKLYSLNKTKGYEVILLINDDSFSKDIYEIDDENYLIIDSIKKTIRYMNNNVFLARDFTKRSMVIKK